MLMNASPVCIEPMRPEHLAQVLNIERLSYPDPWSETAFRKEMENSAISTPIVAVRGDEVLGYIVAWIVVDEAHIGNVAVAPEHRREGLGQRMMAWLLDHAAQRGCLICTLETRMSNVPAQKLYRRLGFRPVAYRKGYYTHPVEDAMVMLKTLETGCEMQDKG